jgi:hypothetical protein
LELFGFQPRIPMLRRKNDVQIDLSERLRHKGLLHRWPPSATPSGLPLDGRHRTQGGAALALGYVRMPRCGMAPSTYFVIIIDEISARRQGRHQSQPRVAKRTLGQGIHRARRNPKGFPNGSATPSGLSQFRAIHRTQGGAALALGYVRLPRCGIHSRALRPDSPTHCSLDAPTHCGPDATHCDPDAPTYCDPDAPTYCDPTPTASPIKAQGRAAHPGRTRARPMDRDPDRVAEKWRWVWSSVRPACNPPPATISKNLFSA